MRHLGITLLGQAEWLHKASWTTFENSDKEVTSSCSRGVDKKEERGKRTPWRLRIYIERFQHIKPQTLS